MSPFARIAQLVERCLAKAKVAGSSPVSRSIIIYTNFSGVCRHKIRENIMKSIIEEASSIAKAVEQAWERAGKPLEFSIKIFQLPQKNFFGFTKVSAKIGIFFGETQQGEKPTRPQRVITHKTDVFKEQQVGKSRPPKEAEVTLWTPELCVIAQEWLQNALHKMDKPHVTITIKPHKHILKVQFSDSLMHEGADDERKFFGNLSYLMLSAIRTKVQSPLKNMQISMRKM